MKDYVIERDLLNWYKTPEIMTFSKKGYPEIHPIHIDEPVEVIPFGFAKRSKRKDVWVHFYIWDYKFERIWNAPIRYLEVLKNYKGIIQPDFSLYTDMPIPLQQYNHYRNNWIASWLQLNDVQVIPNAQWSTEESFDFCFEGMPKNSTIMLSLVGSVQDRESRELCLKGIDKMNNVLEPEKVIVRAEPKTYEKYKQYINNPEIAVYDYNIGEYEKR